MRLPALTALALLCVVACEEPPGAPWHGVSCEQGTLMRPSAPAPAVDLVLVVSDAPTMAPYREALIGKLEQLVHVLELGELPSLRISVVDERGELGTTPRIDGCPAIGERFVEDLALPWFRCTEDEPDGCRDRNYPGWLGEVLPCIAAMPADGARAQPLLARLERALSERDVVRADALLVVLLISVGDDASPRAPSEYAERLRAIQPDPLLVLVQVIGGAGTPRLDALRDAMPNRSSWTSIDDADWAAALDWSSGWGGVVNACLDLEELVDLDPLTAGPQLDCVAEDRDGAALPACRMAAPDRPDPTTPLPCYWLADPEFDEDACDRVAIVERERSRDWAILRCACHPY